MENVTDVVNILRREVAARGPAQASAQVVAVLGGLLGGMGTLAFMGRKMAELDARLVAGAVICLRVADLVPATPVLAHVRFALGAALGGQVSGLSGQPEVLPASAGMLARWCRRQGMWPTVEVEINKQMAQRKAAVDAAAVQA